MTQNDFANVNAAIVWLSATPVLMSEGEKAWLMEAIDLLPELTVTFDSEGGPRVDATGLVFSVVTALRATVLLAAARLGVEPDQFVRDVQDSLRGESSSSVG